METAKGRAWRKHNVYSEGYVSNYDRINWGSKMEDEKHCGGCEYVTVFVGSEKWPEKHHEKFTFNDEINANRYTEAIKKVSVCKVVRIEKKEVCDDGREKLRR